MKFALFRHGPAVPSGTEGIAEEDRPLTGPGEEKTRRAARGLRRLDLGIDAVWSSPLPRACQTASILADVLRLPEPEVSDRLLPGTAAASLVQFLREMKKGFPALVGHEPVLSCALSLLLGSSSPMSLAMKKAGLAVVEIEPPGPHPRATLLLFLPPSVLRSLAR